MVGSKISTVLVSAWALWLFPGISTAFIFGGNREVPRGMDSGVVTGSHHHGGQVPLPAVTFADKYAVALNELQELESEPLCHRTAARLLVNNCQLLDGKDEATILTDSGRQIRDFVDSYAASLAICDLERGSFSIPTTCVKFRESTLSTLPVSSRAVLHVSSREIDSCLSGLARSDSAWSTWVSYRHKSLRFCDAARVDHDKAQNIYVYQRITKILSNLADRVDVEVEERLASVDKRAQDVAEGLERLPPKIDLLWERLMNLDSILSGDVLAGAQTSALQVKNSVEETRNLQKMLSIALQTVLNHNAEVSAAQDHAVELATQRVNNGLELVMSRVAEALSSSTSLQQQIDTSQMQMAELAHKQQILGTNLDTMLSASDDLSSQYAHHQQNLDQSKAKSESILGTLNRAEDSAEALQHSVSGRWGLSGIWPYVICPAATLVMGSYGLPPSAFRNMGLIVMGEFAGFVVSLTHAHSFSPLASFAPWLVGGNYERFGNPSTEASLRLHNKTSFLEHSNTTINTTSG